MVWRSGNALSQINQVILRRARLVLGSMTVWGRPNMSTQLSTLREMVK